MDDGILGKPIVESGHGPGDVAAMPIAVIVLGYVIAVGGAHSVPP